MPAPTIAPFSSADALYAQLARMVAASLHDERATQKPAFQKPAFQLEEIEEYADYCMRALVSVPDAALRAQVISKVTRTRKVRYGWDHQALLLENGALYTELRNADRDLSGTSPASVDLRALLDGQDSYARTQFINTISDIEVAGVATGQHRKHGFFCDDGYRLAAERWSTEEDLIAYCKKMNAALRKKYPVQKFARWLRVDQSRREWVIRLANDSVVQTSHIVEYAQKIQQYLAFADELESAGWKPDAYSHSQWGRLRTWIFEDGEASMPIHQHRVWGG